MPVLFVPEPRRKDVRPVLAVVPPVDQELDDVIEAAVRKVVAAAGAASGHRCPDSNRDSNSTSQRQTSAVSSTHEHSHFAWRLGDTSGLKEGRPLT